MVSAGDIRDVGLIPGLGRSPGGGHGYPLQYACQQNPTDRGAWRATGHSVVKSQTQVLHGRTQSIYFHASLSICHTLSFPLSHVQKPVLYVCISITALTIGPSVPSF